MTTLPEQGHTQYQQDLESIAETFATIEDAFTRFRRRATFFGPGAFFGPEQSIQRVEHRLNRLDGPITGLDGRLAGLERRLDAIAAAQRS